MTASAAVGRLRDGFRAEMPVAISARLGGERFDQAIAQAHANGWTDPEALARIAVADTHGLQAGPAAGKILAQLLEAAAKPCPLLTPTPPRTLDAVNRSNALATNAQRAHWLQLARDGLAAAKRGETDGCPSKPIYRAGVNVR